MDRNISVNEIGYLLDHLNTCYSGINLLQHMETGHKLTGKTTVAYPKILFPLSKKSPEVDELFLIDQIPVLFPCTKKNRWFSVDGRGIRFHHDILKSAFYLLSGYQEYTSTEFDEYGRYPWRSSIQYRLGITQKPVVNYYFNVILKAIEIFSELNGYDFQMKQLNSPLLLLSHDIDRIRKYSLRNMVYTGLQLPGIIPSPNRFSKRWRNFLIYSGGTLLRRKDPYWNFETLISLEQSMHITSTWFLLEKTGRDNSRYHFSDSRIRHLIEQLEEQNHEIGIHGTLESSKELLAMTEALERLNSITREPVMGNRQHFLKYNNPVTTRIHTQAGLMYDSTLGFAEQIGFRNSYSHPFKLYDFKNEKTVDLWELPLNVMDITLLNYMNIPIKDIIETVRPVLNEVAHFNGIFSLLWHNCNLDEEEYPGIKSVYEAMLKEILERGFKPQTGRQIISAVKTGGASGNNS